MSFSAIKVTWTHPAKELMGGQLLGYIVRYEAVRQGDQPIIQLEANAASTLHVCANSSEFVLLNLSSYSMYKIEVAPVTAGGVGNYSDPVYGGTLIQKPLASKLSFLVDVNSFGVTSP